jgi:ATP-binding cassette subfamily C (CFTR/MRP) protein 1
VEQQHALRTSVEAKYKVDQPENEVNDLDHLPPDEKPAFSEKTSSDGKTQQHNRLRDIQDFGAHAQGKKRNKWYQLWRPKNGPPPPPASLDDVPEIPLAKASLFSQLTYTWVTPLMTLGYQRPLMATDLWKMDKSREAGPLGEKFMQAYAKREIVAKEYNAKLADPVQHVRPSRYQRLKWHAELVRRPRRHGDTALPASKRATSHLTRAERLRILEEEWRQGSGRRQASIVMSLNETLTGFWAGGLFKVMGDTAQLMAPLLTKALITFSREGRCVKGLQFTL